MVYITWVDFDQAKGKKRSVGVYQISICLFILNWSQIKKYKEMQEKRICTIYAGFIVSGV